jgi:predicted YcjX-like family ATPase
VPRVTFLDELVDGAWGLLPVRRTIRVGVTGLARSGKTALLTSLAANLLAAGAGLPTLPALSARLAGRMMSVRLAPADAADLPRFDERAKLAALAADPPAWPPPTEGVSLLALDLDIGRGGLAAALPSRQIRLELLDYPGERLLDLPLLGRDFSAWSQSTLLRLEIGAAEKLSAPFRGFVAGLPAGAGEDETLARTGHELFRTLVLRLREELGLTFLQPGRFAMKPLADPPPWMFFFPLPGNSPLAGLLARRYDAYREDVRRDLMSPSFGQVDRLVVLADVLSALHAGADAFGDMRAALGTVSAALRFGQRSLLPGWLFRLVRLASGIERVAFVATKVDHVADRQRGNLAALMGKLTEIPPGTARTESFAVAAIRCTEDFVWTLEGRPVSAVRGRILGDARPARSYPGEVPDRPPDPSFWEHPFLALPAFEPMRPPLGGRGGVPHINLDALLAFLLEDVLP